MLDLEFFYLHFWFHFWWTYYVANDKKQCKKGRDLHLRKTSLILVNSSSFLMEISLIFDLEGWHLCNSVSPEVARGFGPFRIWPPEVSAKRFRPFSDIAKVFTTYQTFLYFCRNLNMFIKKKLKYFTRPKQISPDLSGVSGDFRIICLFMFGPHIWKCQFFANISFFFLCNSYYPCFQITSDRSLGVYIDIRR